MRNESWNTMQPADVYIDCGRRRWCEAWDWAYMPIATPSRTWLLAKWCYINTGSGGRYDQAFTVDAA